MTVTATASSRTPRIRPLAVLILGLLAGLAPLAFLIPPWIPPFLLVLAGWRLYLEAERRALPNRWFVLTLALLGAAAVLATSDGSAASEGLVALLALLVGVKLLETRSPRDHVILALLGYFVVLTDLLFRTTLVTAAFAAGVALVLTAALVDVADDKGRRTVLLNTRLAARMLAQSLPVAAALFLLFPRIDSPLWGAPRNSAAGRTGLAETLSPGSISELVLSEEVAFRATLPGGASDHQPLYWRGPVFELTDGTTWSLAPQVRPGTETSARGQSGIEQTITLEPGTSPWLLGLDAPVTAPPQATLTATSSLRATRSDRGRARYRVVSVPPPRDTGLTPEDRALALQLPRRISPRVRSLALNFRKGAGTDAQVVELALRHFASEAFFYTLRPRPLPLDPVDQFLFETRQGYCEHYASAFTTLMRLAGIPSRVVTGYLGGEWNPLGEYWIVRQSDAHAWSEVWLHDRGWQRVDPTSAVAPGRVERRTAEGGAGPFPFLPSGGGRLGHWLGFLWDSANDGWNRWILGYSAERQRALLTRIGFGDVTWTGLTVALAAALGTLVALGALRAYRAQSAHREPAAVLYLRYCRKLALRGLPRLPQEGHRAYADRVCLARPDLEPHARRVTAAYEALRYARPPEEHGASRRALRELRRAVREVRL